VEKGEFSAADLIQRTGWRKSKTYEVLARAEELGCIAQTDQHGKYRYIKPTEAAMLNLPETIPE
jgi:DNA-binding IclR family transcriptional regulator